MMICHQPTITFHHHHHHYHCHHVVCPTCGHCECCGQMVRWPICQPYVAPYIPPCNPWPYPTVRPHWNNTIIYTNKVTVHESSAQTAINALAGQRGN